MEVTRDVRPIVLIRGFGGLDTAEERNLTHQGFNVGSCYPHKRGQNYIYPGFILSMIRSKYGYHDATNAIGYYSRKQQGIPDAMPDKVATLPPGHFEGTVVLDPFSLEEMLERGIDMRRTLWVFRYYDLGSRTFETYRMALMRMIELVRDAVALQTGTHEAVNVIAHSMGGLIARDTLQLGYKTKKAAHAAINKLVTLGTPHQGIAFQRLPRLDWLGLSAEDELEAFNPETQADGGPAGVFQEFRAQLRPAPPAVRRGDELSGIHAHRLACEPALPPRRGRGAALQPLRRAGEAVGRADPRCLPHIRSQGAWRIQLAGHGAGKLRGRDALPLRQHADAGLSR